MDCTFSVSLEVFINFTKNLIKISPEPISRTNYSRSFAKNFHGLWAQQTPIKIVHRKFRVKSADVVISVLPDGSNLAIVTLY